jgi:hypothetical protein
MDPIAILAGGCILVGGATLSHMLSNRRVRRLHKQAFQMHQTGMSVLANACIEIQCVNYGVTIEEAKAAFEGMLQQTGLPIIASQNPITDAARTYVANKRAAFLAAKEQKNVDPKSA